jgi:hypothetical protein
MQWFNINLTTNLITEYLKMNKDPLRTATDDIAQAHGFGKEGKDALHEFLDMRIDEWFAEYLDKYENTDEEA